MSAVWTVAVNTFRENRRDRVLYVLVLFAAVVILAGVIVGELSPFEQAKILLDLGQATMSLVGSLIAIFLGIGLVSKEIERRTIYVIVSKPVSRTEFLVGKVAGLTMTLTAAVLLMTVMLVLVCEGYGIPPTAALFESIALIWVQLVVLVAMAVTFASFTTTTLAAMFSLSCWIIGQVVGDLKSMAARSDSLPTRLLVGALYWILPNFAVLDAKARASYGIPVPAGELLASVSYGLLYALALLALSSILFSRRDFR
jgi:ABC-type transport system involved in multi-copper enzyme maturation permease subunit